MRLIVTLAIAASVFGQDVSGYLHAAERSTTKDALGRAKAGLWYAEICSDAVVPRRIQRERITREAPMIPFLSNDLAQDLLSRAAARDVRSVIGSNGDSLLGLAAGVSTAVGIGAKSPAAGWIGVGMAGGQLILRLVAKGAPNPAPYFRNLLPDEVDLAPGACHTWNLVSGLMRDPKPVQIIVHFPPAAPAKP